MEGGLGSATSSSRTVYTRAQARAISSAQRLNGIRGHPMFAQILREAGLMGEGEADDGMVLVEGSRLVYFTNAELESSGAIAAEMEDSSDEDGEGGMEEIEGDGVEEDDDDEFVDASQGGTNYNTIVSSPGGGVTQAMTEAGLRSTAYDVDYDDDDDDDYDDYEDDGGKPVANTTSTTTTTTTTTTLNRQASVERVEMEESMMEREDGMVVDHEVKGD